MSLDNDDQRKRGGNPVDFQGKMEENRATSETDSADKNKSTKKLRGKFYTYGIPAATLVAAVVGGISLIYGIEKGKEKLHEWLGSPFARYANQEMFQIKGDRKTGISSDIDGNVQEILGTPRSEFVSEPVEHFSRYFPALTDTAEVTQQVVQRFARANSAIDTSIARGTNLDSVLASVAFELPINPNAQGNEMILTGEFTEDGYFLVGRTNEALQAYKEAQERIWQGELAELRSYLTQSKNLPDNTIVGLAHVKFPDGKNAVVYQKARDQKFYNKGSKDDFDGIKRNADLGNAFLEGKVVGIGFGGNDGGYIQSLIEDPNVATIVARQKESTPWDGGLWEVFYTTYDEPGVPQDRRALTRGQLSNWSDQVGPTKPIHDFAAVRDYELENPGLIEDLMQNKATRYQPRE